MFSIYSTLDQNEPTVLYEVKGEQALFEKAIVEATIKEVIVQDILSEKQKLLIDYLTVTGCEKAAVLLMVAELWEDEATEEMLAYCASNLNASRAQLLKASSEISSRLKRQRA